VIAIALVLVLVLPIGIEIEREHDHEYEYEGECDGEARIELRYPSSFPSPSSFVIWRQGIVIALVLRIVTGNPIVPCIDVSENRRRRSPSAPRPNLVPAESDPGCGTPSGEASRKLPRERREP
jgi:hypothetical protein